ncbi:hypothetical protein [Sediminitomix flava]|uniref:Uncharacterized protein n=1 Tax=Sediminitomix flava TaxID=379075 RepID=A0A315Z7Q8_SEDFL|nr:hypothetical protein [Sediminitomix flava]PWJ40961.1 hypothetical protein BC781_104227 [Sediminitomix flava]
MSSKSRKKVREEFEGKSKSEIEEQELRELIDQKKAETEALKKLLDALNKKQQN